MGVPGRVRYATVMFIYKLQDTLFICYKQSLDSANSIAFSQRTSGTHLIEDETFNDSDIINCLIDYEDGQEVPDSLRSDKMHAKIQLSIKLEKHFLKLDITSQKSMTFQKELRSCASGYRDICKQLANRLSSQKPFSYIMGLKNKSIGIVSASGEIDFELTHHMKMSALDYDE
ncbi:uncharacterized protein TNCV_2650901 [Trichonephila clavipes]|nr:uncharacterized protein TNCV_2650901 [Trichonephila clavipes]